MSWVLLIFAGLAEGALGAGVTRHRRAQPTCSTVALVALLAASMLTLAKATETIPIGTAYAVWVGIGAVGTAIVGMAVSGDPASPARLGFLVLLITAIVGLKLTSGH